ncbi:MAG: type pilus assembly protein PilQ, partial [Thermodesulfobacteriota bacterium]|nr:type pilus assembly protein PilQ [Thermodesulfobacteriota bacterium]
MKKQKWSVGFALCFLCVLCLSVTVGTVKGEGTGAVTPAAPTGYLENVVFEKMAGKERVTIMASRQAGVQVEKLAGRSIAVKMENMFAPTDLRKSFGEGALSNVIRAVPEQASIAGKQTVSVVIELREAVPYSVRQEGNLVIIDYNVAALPAEATPAPPLVAEQRAGKAAETDKKAGASLAPEGSPNEVSTGKIITVDFQEA